MFRIQFLRSWVIALALAMTATAGAQDPDLSSRSALTVAAQGIDAGAETMFEQAKIYVQKMQSTVKRGDKLRQEVKDQKDVVKLNCLNEKMARSTEIVRESERALSELGDAVVSSDSATRHQEFTRIRIFHQKVLVLQVEANNCAGEDGGFVGPAQREVEVDLTVPGGDPTEAGLPTSDSSLLPSGTARSAQPSSPMLPDTTGLGAL